MLGNKPNNDILLFIKWAALQSFHWKASLVCSFSDSKFLSRTVFLKAVNVKMLFLVNKTHVPTSRWVKSSQTPATSGVYLDDRFMCLHAPLWGF